MLPRWSGGTASMSCVGRACNNAATIPHRQCLSCQRRERLCAAERIIQSYLPLLVSQTPSLGSDASPPPAMLMQLSYPWKLHACQAIFYIFIFIFGSMHLVLFSIVLYRTVCTNNIFLYNYLRQMHQIFHLSPVGCFTPARGKTVQKNREVSGVKQLWFELSL